MAPRAKPDTGLTLAGGYTIHPLVLAFPQLDGAALAELAETVRRCGCPPVLKRGEVVLGSYDVIRACFDAGVEVNYREWDGVGSLAETVARAILPAAHLSESQRAAIAVPISDELAGELAAASYANLRPNARDSAGRKNGPMLGSGREIKNPSQTAFSEKLLDAAKLQRPVISKSCDVGVRVSREAKIAADTCRVEGELRKLESGGRAAEIAAELCHVSPRYVYVARRLRDDDRGLFDQVRRGEMTLSCARVAVGKKTNEKKLPPPKGGALRGGRGEGEGVIVGDCLTVMATLKDASIDLIFADPPYNNGWKYLDDPKGDLRTEADYLDWSERWIKHCARLLAPTGSIFVMIDSRWQGRLDVILRNAGLTWRNTIVWRDPFPIHTDARFQPSARFIHYFTRGKKFTFNADAVRVPSKRDELGDTRRVHDRGIVPHDVWDVPRIVGNAADRVPFEDAPPQVPAMILERIIAAASNPGDRVFDPFVGNGTTWRAARKLGRKFSGIERSKLYAAQAERWALAD